MPSFGELKSSLKRSLGYGSVPPIKRRAASPPPLTEEELQLQNAQRNAEIVRRQAEQEEMNQASMIREAMQFQRDEEVSMIISNLNEYLYSFFGEDVNVDIEAPNIRYIVGMIITSNRVRQNVAENVAQKLARSKPLLRAVANFIVNRARRTGRNLSVWLPIIISGLSKVGMFLVRLGVASGRAVVNTGSRVGSSVAGIASGYLNSLEPVIEERAASPRSMQGMASVAYESIATRLSLFYGALRRVLQEVYRLLAPCVAAGASMVASAASIGFERLRAMCSTPEQAVSQAVNQINEQDYECSICMTDAKGPDAVLTQCGHRFHAGCIMPWLTRNITCPNCRRHANPIRSAQAGGGSRKTRSKSKSKSRRYISKPQKSRKARKRVRHASSRRK